MTRSIRRIPVSCRSCWKNARIFSANKHSRTALRPQFTERLANQRKVNEQLAFFRAIFRLGVHGRQGESHLARQRISGQGQRAQLLYGLRFAVTLSGKKGRTIQSPKPQTPISVSTNSSDAR